MATVKYDCFVSGGKLGQRVGVELESGDKPANVK